MIKGKVCNNAISKKANMIVLFLVILFITLSISVFAIPDSLTLQGKLTDLSGASQAGTFNFTFRIYDAFTGGNVLWQDDDRNITTDANGIYDVILHNLSALNFSDQYYLGITVGSDNESEPRVNLTSTPYAFRANISEDLNKENKYTVSVLNVTGNLSIGDNFDDVLTVTTGRLNITDGEIKTVGNLTLGEKIVFGLGQVIDNLISGTLRISGILNVTGNTTIAETLFVDNTSGRVGIGTTTPAYSLDVAGTLRGQNFITSANYSVNDILIPQEVWNYGPVSLTGSIGMDILDWEEKVSATVFESATTIFVSATALTNGNVLIAYEDGGNSNYGTLVIYDSAGNQIKAPTVFESGRAESISATALTNGNVLIAYRDHDNSDYGTFVIYDSAGNQIKAPTVFESGGIYYISATALTNGNVLIAYDDWGNSGYGTFVIYDSAGNLVRSATVFEGADSYEISATALTNGNVLITYEDGGNSNYGTLVIYDSAGNQIKAPTVFESAFIGYISTTTLVNGNVLIAYRDYDNSDYGTFVIYDSAGNLVRSATVFESATTNFVSATALTNGNVLIAYEDGGNSNYGTFVIYDSAGNQIKAPTVFESGRAESISATALTNGNVLIAYEDGGNSNYGTLVVWQGNGAEFSQDLVVDGNVGIGSTVPNATLFVQGNITAVGNLNVTGTAYIGNLNISGVTFGQGDIDAQGSLRVSGGANISGDLGVGGNIYGEIPDAWKLANFTSAHADYNSSLWNASGANIFNREFDGNVGIGDTTPSDALEVIGNVRVSGSLNASEINATKLRVNNTLFVNGSKVGIGTTHPSYKLEVIGDVYIDKNIWIGDGITTESSVMESYAYSSANYFRGIEFYISNELSANANELTGAYLEATHGSSDYSVSNLKGVYGQAFISGEGAVTNMYGGQFIAQNDGAAPVTNAYGVYGKVLNSAEANTISNAYGVYADIGQSPITNAYGVYIDDISGTNQWGLYQAGKTDGNYFAGYVTILGSLNATYINASEIRVGEDIVQVEKDAWKLANFTSAHADYNSSLWNASGANIFNREFDGNVGIGTTSPSHRLDVIGNASIKGNLSVDSNMSVDGNTFFVDSTNNRVGIGTTSPSSPLTVSFIGGIEAKIGDSLADLMHNDADTYLTIGQADANANLLIGQSGSNFGALSWVYSDTPANAYLTIGTTMGNNNIILNPGTGKVGVGTTNPTYLLTVDQAAAANVGKDVNLSDIMFVNSSSEQVDVYGNLTISNLTSTPAYMKFGSGGYIYDNGTALILGHD